MKIKYTLNSIAQYLLYFDKYKPFVYFWNKDVRWLVLKLKKELESLVESSLVELERILSHKTTQGL